MVIMWFSGLRGAIAYALSLHLEFDEDVRKVIVTTTLVVVLFTTICLGKIFLSNSWKFGLYHRIYYNVWYTNLYSNSILGGGTLPLIKYLERKKPAGNRKKRRGAKKQVTMSKTRELGSAIGINQLFL